MSRVSQALKYAALAAVFGGATCGGAWCWQQRSPLARAHRAYANGQFDRALDEVSQTLKTTPGDPAALALAGRCLYRLGRYRDAEESCFRWLPLSAHSEEDLRLRAEGLISRRRWEIALPVCEELQSRVPDEPRSLQRLSVVAFQLGQFEVARQSATKLLNTPTHVAAAWCLLGVIAEAQDRPDEAAACFEKALAADPAGESLPVLPQKIVMKLAANLRRQGRLDRARDVLEAQTGEGATAELETELADVYWALGQVDQATELWQAALDRKPAYSPALVGLGRAALLQNRPAEALGHLQAAAKANGTDRELHHLLSQAYARTGNLELAATHAKEADRLRKTEADRNTADLVILQQPDSLAAQILMSQRAIEAGNRAEAESLLQDLRRQAPNDPRVQALCQQWTIANQTQRSNR